jgi:transposase
MSEPILECPNCAELLRSIEMLERKIGCLLAKVAQQEKKIRELQEQLAGRKKDSSNSSKPPSSDIVKPSKKLPKGQRRRGGQEGHAAQQRPPFSPEEIDAVQRHAYEACPQCGGPVEQSSSPAQVLQQVELVVKPTRVTEHQSYACRCLACQQDFTRPIPPEISKAGTFGPRLTTYVAYLKGACHASYGTIQQLLKETCQLDIATGTLVQLCQKVARSLLRPYCELLGQIPRETSLNIDETGHRENGRRLWTWVFRARAFTLFQIQPTRSTDVLNQTLGENFAGTLMADYYAAYRKYLAAHPQADAQFCWAHLVRDVKFLETLPGEADRQFATELIPELTGLFQLWHSLDAAPEDATLRAALIAQGARIANMATECAPDTKASQAIAKRFRKHGSEYLRFTKVSGVEPTNNAAEQAIRHVVIDRGITQGTRSPRGQVWCERIWTTIATCRQQKRDLLLFLEQSLLAQLTNTPPPSLLAAV